MYYKVVSVSVVFVDAFSQTRVHMLLRHNCITIKILASYMWWSISRDLSSLITCALPTRPGLNLPSMALHNHGH